MNKKIKDEDQGETVIDFTEIHKRGVDGLDVLAAIKDLQNSADAIKTDK